MSYLFIFCDIRKYLSVCTFLKGLTHVVYPKIVNHRRLDIFVVVFLIHCTLDYCYKYIINKQSKNATAFIRKLDLFKIKSICYEVTSPLKPL